MSGNAIRRTEVKQETEGIRGGNPDRTRDRQEGKYVFIPTSGKNLELSSLTEKTPFLSSEGDKKKHGQTSGLARSKF